MIRRFCSVFVAASLILGAVPVSARPPAGVVGSDYSPQDKDEQGLWMQANEYERDLKQSNFVIADPALNTYVRDVFCRAAGADACRPIRIYILRTAHFNAAMYPNGAMIVFSGLFLRTRNEAQLAAVLMHEYTHYRERHSLRQFRDLKAKANTASVFGLLPIVGSLVQLGIISSIFSYSREQERAADAGSIPLMANAGYEPHQASAIWEQLRAEMDATAVARAAKSRKDKDRGMFESHPPTAERVTALRMLADRQPVSGTATDDRSRYRTAMAPWWPALVDDQIKLNDFGGTEFLLEDLGKEGWTSDLLYARGELYRARAKGDDLSKAANFYRDAIAKGDAPVESWRGIGLALLRSGDTITGQAALKSYLQKKPEAKDKPMIAMMAGITS